jgi:hypothetical protein
MDGGRLTVVALGVAPERPICAVVRRVMVLLDTVQIA